MCIFNRRLPPTPTPISNSKAKWDSSSQKLIDLIGVKFKEICTKGRFPIFGVGSLRVQLQLDVSEAGQFILFTDMS